VKVFLLKNVTRPVTSAHYTSHNPHSLIIHPCYHSPSSAPLHLSLLHTLISILSCLGANYHHPIDTSGLHSSFYIEAPVKAWEAKCFSYQHLSTTATTEHVFSSFPWHTFPFLLIADHYSSVIMLLKKKKLIVCCKALHVLLCRSSANFWSVLWLSVSLSGLIWHRSFTLSHTSHLFVCLPLHPLLFVSHSSCFPFLKTS